MKTAAVIAAAVLLIGATQLSRPGYSVDEEFTVFAVRGIASHGLPLLPSGLLYDRGIAYSYASWIASWLPGDDLANFRELALLSSVGALLIIGSSTSLLAMSLVAISIPFWAVATTGRFYGPFFLTFAVAPLAIERRSLPGLFVAAVLCRWTHELAFTLVAIPAMAWLLDRDQRRYWFTVAVVIAGGLLAAQAVIFAVHYSAPSSGETMIRRFFVWQLLNILQRPPDRQFGISFAVMLLGVLIAPRRASTIVVVSLCIAAAIAGQSIAMGFRPDGYQYPLDMFWFIARLAPATLVLALSLIAYRIVNGREWPLRERAFHIAWVLWVVAFGMADAGITLNYVLVPVALMLIAIATEVMTIEAPSRHAAIAVVIVLVAGDQWRHGSASLTEARPTINIEGIEAVRDSLEPTDRVACTDELACLLLVGRVDNWLALDDYVRERFVVEKKDGSRVGVYAGAPAVFRPVELFTTPDSRLPTPGRILIVDVFKDYAVGNSRTWLPRALALDGIEGKVLLETPQARVVQISAPERNARLQPMP